MSDKSSGIRCMWMRGGTSKGGYFLKDDLPSNPEERDALLLSIMGSPDARQIDGMGGADPLTSKVAIISKSQRSNVDLDYLFLQVAIDQALASDSQNCGNILAGVGPFAIERGIIPAKGDETNVSIFMENSGQIAVATIETPCGKATYEGEARIDGVPGTAAAVLLEFKDIEGSTCGALLPTGNVSDVVDGIEVTMIDNGMPVVVLDAVDVGIIGNETREELDADSRLKSNLESIRMKCGRMMNLGDVCDKTVPKMTLISNPQNKGAISTRTFIPHRCHASIGVLGAVSVASACLLGGTKANRLANIPVGLEKTISIEHPSGETTIIAKLDNDGNVNSSAVLRTANKLMDGNVYP